MRLAPALRTGWLQIMVDLYAVLGVARDADVKTIRRAFRKKVRSAHPDGGGSVGAFNELKTAYDVLSDPIRRRQYDETGEVGDRAADPHRAKIIEILSVGLDLALLKRSKTPRVQKDSDVMRLMAEALAGKRLEWNTQKGHFGKALEEARRLEARFRVAEGENLMEAVVAGRISACEKQIDHLAELVKLVDEALVILHNTRFDSLLELTNGQDSPHELTDEQDSPVELTDDQKRVYSLLDRSTLVRFK